MHSRLQAVHSEVKWVIGGGMWTHGIEGQSRRETMETDVELKVEVFEDIQSRNSI